MRSVDMSGVEGVGGICDDLTRTTRGLGEESAGFGDFGDTASSIGLEAVCFSDANGVNGVGCTWCWRWC